MKTATVAWATWTDDELNELEPVVCLWPTN